MRRLSIGLLVAIIGPACKRQEARDDRAPNPPTQAVSPAPTNADSGDSAWDSPEAVRLSGLHYTPPIQGFGTLSVTSPDGYFDSIGPGYKIGTFVDGRYRGADMVSAQLRTDEPCKGDGCDDPAYLRFVKVGDQFVFLRKILGWRFVSLDGSIFGRGSLPRLRFGVRSAGVLVPRHDSARL